MTVFRTCPIDDYVPFARRALLTRATPFSFVRPHSMDHGCAKILDSDSAPGSLPGAVGGHPRSGGLAHYPDDSHCNDWHPADVLHDSHADARASLRRDFDATREQCRLANAVFSEMDVEY